MLEEYVKDIHNGESESILEHDMPTGPYLCLYQTYSATISTRASAQRVTNTPGQCHSLIIKYFKVNDNDIRQDIVYNVSL